MPPCRLRPSALRPRCAWPGCQRGARQGGYCQQHTGLAAPESPHVALDIAAAAPPAPLAHNSPEQPRKRARKHNNSPISADVGIDDYQDDMLQTLVFDGMILQCPHCGSWNFPAERVGSGLTAKVTLCCQNGKVSLPPLPDAPQPLRSWLRGDSALARHVRQNIRRYNAAMSFVSFGAQLEVRSGARGVGSAPPVCIVHGAVYHHSHPLRPARRDDARFAQMYLYDATEATSLRLARDTALREDVLSDLANMLDTARNPYVDAYRRMGELTQAVRAHVKIFLTGSLSLHGLPNDCFKLSTALFKSPAPCSSICPIQLLFPDLGFRPRGIGSCHLYRTWMLW